MPPTTRSMTSRQTTLWRLPPELRNIVYSYVLSSDRTTSTSLALPVTTLRADRLRDVARAAASPAATEEGTFERIYEAPSAVGFVLPVETEQVVLDTAIMRTCRQAFSEVSFYIANTVTVLFKISFASKLRKYELQALKTVRRVKLKFDFTNAYDELDEVPKNFPWTGQLTDALALRADVHTFEFEGEGRRIILPSVVAKFDVKYQPRLAKRYIKIIEVLGNLPVVAATHAVLIGWRGDDKLVPEDDTAAQAYHNLVKALQMRVGSKEAEK